MWAVAQSDPTRRILDASGADPTTWPAR
ncbi:hypothetical protein ABZV78_14550 [Micromonospora sp. NPDC004540]